MRIDIDIPNVSNMLLCYSLMTLSSLGQDPSLPTFADRHSGMWRQRCVPMILLPSCGQYSVEGWYYDTDTAILKPGGWKGAKIYHQQQKVQPVLVVVILSFK